MIVFVLLVLPRRSPCLQRIAVRVYSWWKPAARSCCHKCMCTMGKCSLLCASQVQTAAYQSEWFDLLSTFQWGGKSERLLEICDFIIRNGFSQWPQLQHAEDPGTWDGADAFDNSELNIVRAVASVGKQQPRYKMWCLVCVDWLGARVSPSHDRSPRSTDEVQELKEGKVGAFLKRCQPMEAEGVGPRKALKRLGLEAMNQEERLQWMEQARLCAIFGGMQYCMNSWKSGVRCYIAFVGTTTFLSKQSCACVCVCVHFWCCETPASHEKHLEACCTSHHKRRL